MFQYQGHMKHLLWYSQPKCSSRTVQSLKTEECLTTLDNSMTAQHHGQPICWKASSEESAYPHTAETKRLLLLWLPIMLRVVSQKKDLHLASIQFPRENSQYKDKKIQGFLGVLKNEREEKKKQFTISLHSFKITAMEEMCKLKCFSPLSGIWRGKDQVPQSVPSCPKPS